MGYVLCLSVLIWVISGVICAGLFFASAQGAFPMIAKEQARSVFGWAIILGVMYGIGGPLGVLAAWLVTGMGQHGWKMHV